jgi:hypothetical protein
MFTLAVSGAFHQLAVQNIHTLTVKRWELIAEQFDNKFGAGQWVVVNSFNIYYE